MSGALSHSLGDALVDMTVRFEPVTLSSSDIIGVQPGDVIPLHHPVDAPLTVTIGDIPCFAALPGRRGRRLACVIVDPTSEVVTP
jgi:flagellar motor switch protein FliM